jgi:enamine deaminase RidA (YjgF/YER057c/UK114 family)
MNKVYEEYFDPKKLPARTCIGVTGLAVGASIEIDLIAKL